jgi:hypothetical protein
VSRTRTWMIQIPAPRDTRLRRRRSYPDQASGARPKASASALPTARSGYSTVASPTPEMLYLGIQ